MRALFLAAIAACACRGQTGKPMVPEKLKPPAGETLFLMLQAKGDQIYTCRNANGSFAWTLKAPDARLFDQGKEVGRHFEGPTWALSDGGSVVGRVAARQDSPDSGSIPWLLLTAVGHSGQGALTAVTHIQRIETRGGEAPATGCDASKDGKELRIPYTAIYAFFK
jgi:hypothetical protein